jgi:hypothetical protein
MFLIRIDRFARLISIGSFLLSHTNEHILGVSDTGTVLSHDSPICEPPSLAGYTLLNILVFLKFISARLTLSQSKSSLHSQAIEFNRHNQILVIIVVRLFARRISYYGTD